MLTDKIENNTTPTVGAIGNNKQESFKTNEQIDLKAVFHRIKEKKWKLAIIILITIVLSIAIIFPVPRYYQSSVELAPELGISNTGGGSLSDIASSMGINIGEGVITDAISPELYPDLMKSNTFVIQLINCRVKSNDGKIDTTYYQYLLKHQKYAPAAKFIGSIKKIFTPKKKNIVATSTAINPFKLTKEQDDIFGAIKNNIKGSTDKKTNVITITVEDQDPLIAATMAENARKRNAYIIYMNGMVAKASEGKVEPGCEIVVPSKILRHTSTAELLSIGTSISSIAAMIATIANMTK